MSREKQIEELANFLWHNTLIPVRGDCDELAETLYNAGYRKQSEGEWVFKGTYYEADECTCSLCGQHLTTAKGERMNFCPNCGAKMKGGAE